MGKLPPDAKKVFDGIIFDVYHYNQKMYNGTTETFEMLKRADTAIVIPTANNCIYFIEEEQPGREPFIGTPGGRQNKNEDPLTAAKRELLEETGLESNDWELWHSVEPYTKIDWTIHIFIARDCKQVAKLNLDAGEKITVKKVLFDEWIELVINKHFYEFEITQQILRMKLESKKLDAFKKKLFTHS